MASRTTSQNFWLLNVILAQQVFSVRNFSGAAILRGPLHVENLFFWTHEAFGIAMTIKAPFHLQRRRLIRNRHLIDAAMTSGATDPFVYVDTVIEKRIVRQVVYSDPLDRFTGPQACAHRFEIGTVSPDLLVTVHARFRRRHAGGRRLLHRRMAITTIDAVIANVMFMAKLDWLLPFDPLSCVPGRAIDFIGYPKGGKQDEDRAEDA